jgi:hypothetical protein
MGNGLLSRDFGRDDRFGAESEESPDAIGVVGAVSKHMLGREPVDQGFGLRAVVDLTWRKDQAERIAKSVDGDMDFGAQPAARAADRLRLNPPFPPAACWCARMIVASMMRCSRSGSSLSAARMCDQTPRLAQRENRRNIEFQWPNVSGRSRHGAPVRASQSTASTNNRLSAP